MDFIEPRRLVGVRLVGGRGHYEGVVQAVMQARRSVWIATANLKELMVEDHRAAPGRRRVIAAAGRARAARAYRLIIGVFAELAGRGVELRILHAAVPSRAFRAEHARHTGWDPDRVPNPPRWVRSGKALPSPTRLAGSLELRACPRVHFKAVVVDGEFLYLGSANWTGAGLGAKGTGRRNFELGFATADDGLLDRVQEIYDRVWRGAECAGCKLRDVCPAPLDGLRAKPAPAPRSP